MKIIVVLISLILAVAIAFFAYNFFMASDPLKSDKHINFWVAKCGSDSQCKQGVKEHYSACIDSLSFEKPKIDASTPEEVKNKKAAMDEYYSLIKAEISDCLSDKTGIEL